MEKTGHFRFETDEYVVHSPMAEKPLENFLFNDRYFTCVFHTGNGYAKYVHEDGTGTQVIEGSSEPGFRTNTRLIYIKDEDSGEFWNVGFFPVRKLCQSFECRLGAGYVILTNVTEEIQAIWRIFVPSGTDPVEIWTLEIANLGRRKRDLSVFAYAELSLRTPAPLYGHETYLNSKLLEDGKGIAAGKISMNLPHPYFGAVLLSSCRPDSADANYDAFCGRFGELSAPDAVRKGRCSGAVSSRDRIAGVLHKRITLEPDASFRCDYLAGAANVYELEKEAEYYRSRYLVDGGIRIDGIFKETVHGIKRHMGSNQISTPDRKLDALFNCWIPRLIEYGVTHCRWGLFGYRDIIQQAQGAVMCGSAELARERLLKALSYQYSNGFAVRSYPPVHEDSRMRYADSAFWLICSVVEYIKETGDLALLDRRIPYLDGTAASVLAHLEQAVEALGRDKGEHGLCLIMEGDWNDSLTHAGRKGRGESVMLSESYCYACQLMEELMVFLGYKERAARYRVRYEQMKKSLNEHCWDGEWYIRAFDDTGSPIGSKTNEQGEIYLNAQSWAMIAGIVPKDRLTKIRKSIHERLHTPYGYMLLYPTYTRRAETIGRLSCIEPGCSENGSVYSHGNAFLALGLLRQGKGDEAFDVIQKIMPYNPSNPSFAVLPYQLSNGYGGKDHRYDPGRAQYGWVTGSGSWLYMVLIDYIFGLRKTYGGLKLRPMLPTKWDKAAIRRKFRGCVYEIAYIREQGQSQGGCTIRVNGKEHERSACLPSQPGEIYQIEVFID